MVMLFSVRTYSLVFFREAYPSTISSEIAIKIAKFSNFEGVTLRKMEKTTMAIPPLAKVLVTLGLSVI